MENKSDAQLRRILKNWVSRPAFPMHVRERILTRAAATCNKINLNAFPYRPQINSYPLTYTNDWTQTLFTWINENSFQPEFHTRLGEYAF